MWNWTQKKELIIGLDHNLDLLKCNTHKQTENFLETNLEHGLIPTIIRPTRITNTTTTLIDNIMVSKKFCGITKSSVLIENASDHLVCLTWIENFKTVGVSCGYTDHYQGRGHSIRLTAVLINIHEHLI